MMIAVLALAAAQMDVAGLRQLCLASAPSCRLFVSGVMEGAHLAAAQSGNRAQFCAMAPSEASSVAAAFVGIADQDMREHPADARLAATSMVAAVAEQMHPCH